MPPEIPQNGGYLVAAYVIATVILVGYWVALWRRARKSVSGREGEKRA
jgi:cytochrome oxidase assembly protein ShyY1